MDNPRAEKVAVVDEVRERFNAASAAILTEYRGLAVKDLATLRRSLREAGAEYAIYKNTLVRFAVRDLSLAELDEMLTGPTAIAFIDGDAAAVAKALREFARTNPNLVVKGGLLGDKVLTASDAGALADLPSREVLLSRIAGGLAAPLQQFAGLLQALPRNLAYGLKALIEKSGGVPEPEAEPAPEPAAPVAEAIAAEEPAAEAPAAEAPAAEAETPAAETPEAETPAAPESTESTTTESE
jgi:large subunit ribosomal protein L10